MKIAIIQYSTYGHITTLAREVQQGVLDSGLATKADLFQVQETLSDEVLKLIHAPEKPSDIPVADKATFEDYDAFLFGIPTRFGNLPAQWVELWGQTGGLWAQGALQGKPAGIFVSTGTPNGGQEVTARAAITYLTHHGLPYIPLGYATAFPELTSFDEVHGGSPYGAGTLAGADGSREPSNLELKIAKIQGTDFAKSAIKFVKKSDKSSEKSTGTAAAGTSKAATAGDATGAAATGAAAGTSKAATDSTGTTEPAAKEVNESTNATSAREQQSTKTTKPDEKSGCSKCVIV